MIKQKHLALMSEHYFNTKLIILYFLTFFLVINIINAEDDKVNKNIAFPAAVIDMKAVLSKSLAFTTLQKEIQKLEEGYKKEISSEEEILKKEQENLSAQKAVLSQPEYQEKEEAFKLKVNKIQSKVEKIRRDLETTMAKGMQIIQQEAVKHMKEIAKKEGYLLVFDANTTIISADKINISKIVVDKLNKSLPSISVEKKKDKKVD